MKLALILIAAGLECLALTSRSVAQQQGQFGTATEANRVASPSILLRPVVGSMTCAMAPRCFAESHSVSPTHDPRAGVISTLGC